MTSERLSWSPPQWPDGCRRSDQRTSFLVTSPERRIVNPTAPLRDDDGDAPLAVPLQTAMPQVA